MSKLEILFRNSDFLAVNKGTGKSVHSCEDTENLLSTIEAEMGISLLFPVHRLDKETSGIQLIALTKDCARDLANEFQGRKVEKIYTGIIRGQLDVCEGIWTTPLTDKAEGRRNPEGTFKDRVSCETRFQVLRSNRYFSLCKFVLVTGRQHQIRKHTALAKHHLIGDPRYGDLKYNRMIHDRYQLQRMFLHCSFVKIVGQIIECPAPVDFDKFFSKD
ncbi:MAG: RNA pseudouridine synthase [Bdellovibrionales bacterium]|nr:RNA pseudouridine synthase [Bdellovibrionales bacterium]